MKNNPFNPNSVVRPSLFAGRARQVLQVVRRLSQVRNKMPVNFIISGERGIGKTALAKFIMYLSEKKDKDFGDLNFLTTYYMVEKNQSIQSVLQSTLNLLTDKLPNSAIDSLKTKLGKFFEGGKFSIGAFGAKLDVEKNKSNTENTYLKDQSISILTNILKVIQNENNFDGILIVLDDIHNAKNLSGFAQILRNIVTTLDMNGDGNIAFLILSYPDAIHKFFKGDPSAQRIFDNIPLGIMPKSEAKEILRKGFDEVKIDYKKEDIDENISKAGGYPHSIQSLGYHLIEEDRDNNIDQEDWIEAIKKAAYDLQKKEFSDLYNFDGKMRQREEVLNILALMNQPVSKTDMANAFKKFGNKNIHAQSCLPALKKSGAIKEDSGTGNLSLQSYLFKSAIKLHIATQIGNNRDYLSSESWYKVYEDLYDNRVSEGDN